MEGSEAFYCVKCEKKTSTVQVRQFDDDDDDNDDDDNNDDDDCCCCCWFFFIELSACFPAIDPVH